MDRMGSRRFPLSSNPSKRIQLALLLLLLPQQDRRLFPPLLSRGLRVPSSLKRVPEPKSLVPRTSHDGLSIRTHRQVKDTVGMPREGRYGGHTGVLPETDLIRYCTARVPVCGNDFARIFRPDEVTHLEGELKMSQTV
jgi:hypothetical protein